MLKKTLRAIFLLAGICWCWSCLPDRANVYAQEKKPTEYQVKAAFIYNFLQFIEYPLKPFKGPHSQLNLTILGENPFGAAFENYQGETIQGKKLSIRHAQSLHDFKDGHILFICPSEKSRVPQIVKQVADLGILTIGDTEGFARQGVMINFYMEGNRVRFEINVDVARRAGFKISSHLLKLAKIVQESP